MEFRVKTEIIEIRKLTASEGTILTNGELYGREIYLGKFDTPENYYEITEEEYNELKSENVEPIM